MSDRGLTRAARDRLTITTKYIVIRVLQQREAPMRRHALTCLALALGLGLSAPAPADTRLLNVSYDPTREFYKEFNEAFAADYAAKAGVKVTVKTSHGGSGKQARSVIDGLGAQVVTLALGGDIDAIAAKTGKIPADWAGRLPHNSSPYTSTIVFLVREGNPKGVKDWGDLVQPGVGVITPNPKTSGGARWNYLAAWAYADKAFGGDEGKTVAFMQALFANVPVLDSGARGASTTFAERGIGDVLIAWENEAYLALAELGDDKFDIVVPSLSIRAEPPVALVEGNLKDDEQRAAAAAYLDFLYAPKGQALAARHFFRVWDVSAAAPEDAARFPELDLVTIDGAFGGWAAATAKHFAEGGLFDTIYVRK